MPSIAALSVFAGLAALSVASPTPIEEQLAKRGTFSIEQKAAGKVHKNGAIALNNAYKKYMAEVPAHVAAAAAAAASTGSATTTPEAYDEAYLTPVLVGSQTLTMDFDTGSSDLWVFSSELPASEGTGHTLYTVSSSKLKSGYTWDISYGDGSGASGNVAVDKVVIGGVTATSQAVEAATSVSSSFTANTDNDGLVGFAFSSINTVSPQQQLTWFDNVKSSLTQKLFTATLKKGKAGTYDFGYLDSSKYTGSIVYSSVDTSNGFWEFHPTGYAVGSGATVSSTIDAIADTGTTLLLLPQAINTAYYKQVSGAAYSSAAGGYLFPCSATLPSFTLIIGGQKRTIPGSYLNYAPYSSTKCYGGLQPDTGIGFSIVGDIFLKGQYVVFDQTQSTPRVGFAQQAGVTV